MFNFNAPEQPERTPNPEDEGEEREITPGGSEVIRHESRVRDELHAVIHLSEDEMNALERHVEAHVGPVENVLHEIVSDGLHLDLLPVEPDGETRPFYFLGTMGMSALPMTLPEDYPGPEYAELFILLPPDWPRTQQEIEAAGEDAWWPYRLLKTLARIPHEYETFLGPGHTVPNGDPPEPFADSVGFAGAMLVDGGALADEFAEVTIGDKTVQFLLIVPLFAEEMEYKLEHGAEALLERLESAEIGLLDIADPKRPNACAS